MAGGEVGVRTYQRDFIDPLSHPSSPLHPTITFLLSLSRLYILGEPPKGVKKGLKKALWEDVDRRLLSDTAKGKTTGTVSVTFTQGEETRNTMAIPGQGLSEIASQADQFIKYKCKKGECGTCEVLVDGQWVRSCVTKIPSGVEEYNVQVRPSMVKSKKGERGWDRLGG